MDDSLKQFVLAILAVAEYHDGAVTFPAYLLEQLARYLQVPIESHYTESVICRFCGRDLLAYELISIGNHQRGATDCPSIKDYKAGPWYQPKGEKQ